jgi:hypothetical protein
MGREDLRALYSDVMKTLYDEAFYGGVYNPEEVKYAVEKENSCSKSWRTLKKENKTAIVLF